MSTLQEKIAVMQAHADGKKIEVTYDGEKWVDSRSPAWNWARADYRVKEEPKKTGYYRRYITQYLGYYRVGLVFEDPGFDMVAAVRARPNFVRWIDNEWQQEIV